MKLVILLLVLTVNIFPQSFSVMGLVADSTDKHPLANANVILIHLRDSTVRGTATAADGSFNFSNLPQGRYTLNISYVGYKRHTETFGLRNGSLDLERILLSPGESRIDDIEITDTRVAVIQNADTTEYSADAFKAHKDADAEELVGKMPGITVTDGKVKAQGEEVKRVLVDGRAFFGDDPTAVLRNLPAEIIEKIQIFDEQSEQSRFTGFEDGNTTKTMNVVTRNRIRQGTFGRFTGGYGDDQRYNIGGNLNIFNDEQRISIVGQINNINEQNFSREDLAGVMSSSGRGRGGPGGGGGVFMGGYGGGFGGGNFQRGSSDFLVTAMNGLSTTKALGLNYTDKFWDKFSLQGSYFINRTDNSADANVQREYFLDQNMGQKYFEDNSSSSTNINHRINMRMEFQIDSLNDVMFRPRISLQQNDGSNRLFGQTFSDGTTLNAINNIYSSDISAVNSSAELLYRHRFETRGRTFSIAVNGSYNDNDGDSRTYSENTYLMNSALSDTLNQISDLYRDGRGVSSNMMYTEPIGENGMVQFTTGLSYSKDESDQRRFRVTATDALLDTSVSNLADKSYQTQTFGTGYRYQKNEITFNTNLNYNISLLNNEQEFPYPASTGRRFTSLTPSMMMRYSFSKDKNLHFFYRTNNNDPRIEQLQDVLDNSNPIQLSIGNPDLKQDYRHSFNMRYSQMNIETLNSMFIMLNGSLTNNYIGTSTLIAGRDTINYRGIILNPGSQLSTPVNLNGFFNIASSIVYSMPFNLIMSYINFNLDASYSRIPGMVNYNQGHSNSNTYSLGVVVSSNISPDLDFTLSSNSSFNKISSNLRRNYSEDYFTQTGGMKFRFQFWDGFIINNNLLYQYDNGLPEDYNRNIVLWNMSLGKKVFSNNQGEIKLTAYDILNKNTTIQRTNTSSYVQDVRSNTIGRYFILSFTYQLRAFGS
jgi:hypothetical protein